VLDGQDAANTLINIGATAEGISAVYDIAKLKGFTTMGIVSTLARDERVALSQCVDYVFFVKDRTWGEQIPGTNHLSPTSAAIVGFSQQPSRKCKSAGFDLDPIPRGSLVLITEVWKKTSFTGKTPPIIVEKTETVARAPGCLQKTFIVRSGPHL